MRYINHDNNRDHSLTTFAPLNNLFENGSEAICDSKQSTIDKFCFYCS